jgi:Ala-tRNA(Pro) deacylase
MAAATWIREELDQKGVVYQEVHHADAATAQEVAQREHVSGHRVAKVVGILADARPYELVLPASRRVRLDWVRELLGAREVRLATEEELGWFFTGCEVGAIPALRHWPGVEVIMDGHLLCDGDIFILGGTHRDALRMRFDDWFNLVAPRVELLSEPGDPRPKGSELQ